MILIKYKRIHTNGKAIPQIRLFSDLDYNEAAECYNTFMENNSIAGIEIEFIP